MFIYTNGVPKSAERQATRVQVGLSTLRSCYTTDACDLATQRYLGAPRARAWTVSGGYFWASSTARRLPLGFFYSQLPGGNTTRRTLARVRQRGPINSGHDDR